MYSVLCNHKVIDKSEFYLFLVLQETYPCSPKNPVWIPESFWLFYFEFKQRSVYFCFCTPLSTMTGCMISAFSLKKSDLCIFNLLYFHGLSVYFGWYLNSTLNILRKVTGFWKLQPFLTLSNINKSVYDFILFIFRLSTVCLLSVCPYTNSVKYIRIDLKLIYAIDIYYGMFFVENEAYNVCFFTRTFKRIPLFYGLWGRIICGDI